MPVQPDIALQATTPNPTNFISSFLDLGQKKLNLDKSRATYDADVANAQAISQTNQAGAQVATATVQPKIDQQFANTSTAQSQAGTAASQMSDAQLANIRNHVANETQQIQTLANDPNLTRAKVISAVTSAAANANAPTASIAQSLQGLPDDDDPVALKGFLASALQRAQAVTSHLNSQYPAPSAVSTDQGTQFVATGNPQLTGQQPGTPQGAPLAPPNQVTTDTSGNSTIINPAKRTAQPFNTPPPAAPGAPPAPQMSFPPGETAQTRDELQGERTAAKNVSLNAPQMHDINRSIVQEVDKGINTGTLGQLTQKLSSATGFSIGDQSSTDYNVLGKMLERSALTAAQGMGPHTNAGLEAQVRANGSTDYTPGAIRKIANLNDALTTGSTLYQQGLENAISTGGSVFAKRQFDQQWATAMNPAGGVNGVQALRLKNAVDNGDQKETAAVIAEVGGRGSKGATALLSKLQSIRALSGQ